MTTQLSPELLVSAYAQGMFPMADEFGEIGWYSPDPRAIIELDSFHVSQTLRQVYRQKRFELTLDRSFEEVIDACAAREEGTWINDEIRDAYLELHRLGFAHSVEAWRDERLAGGLYGVALGGAFFGESMFHNKTDASKVALVFLVEHMKHQGYQLLDTQFNTPHLKQFNCAEIPRAEYLRRLDAALQQSCTFAGQA